jgi:hypothetical protein
MAEHSFKAPQFKVLLSLVLKFAAPEETLNGGFSELTSIDKNTWK